ncbi:hypothetical protein COCNU_scaffold033492G000010 [Cocos nucifera]|nr:hypothetical protein [Cocos nucifera]
MAKPGQSRRISVAAPFRPEVLQNHLQIILYYKKAREEESASVVAAWIKESLNVAIADEPLLAGRLRRDDEGDGCWEIKFNDSGVRLVQASAEMTMSEFLGSKERDGREGQLAYWVDLDKENPRYSALFYIQVTQFQGDGYSIGISCSLLLADPLFLARFLKSWAQTHTQMLAQGQLSMNPMFHLDYFKRSGRPTHIKSIPLDCSISTNPTPTTTMLFKVARARDQGSPSYNELAILCLKEATQRIEGRATSNFTLITSDHAGDLKVESCGTKGLDQISKSFGGAFSVAWWDELGIEEMTFDQGNRPIHASYRVVSCADEGHVIVMLPSDEEDSTGLMINTTILKKI